MPKSSRIEINSELEHLFRHEYGKLMSILLGRFQGLDSQLAEDVVQDAMVEAARSWSYNGLPDNPSAWLYKVARNKALNLLKRDSKIFNNITSHQEYIEPKELYTDKEIADDQLRMIFTTCHPKLSSDSQVALTLKILCGFSVKEIAQAFLKNEESIKKRITRAKQQMREIEMLVPVGKSLEKRLDSVLEVLYLLYNEGYHASTGILSIRKELCSEAIRLLKIVIESDAIVEKAQANALMALMLLNLSRFDARAHEGQLINLQEQNRSLWDREMIQSGLFYLDQSKSTQTVTLYHLLATISAYHTVSKDYDSTNWKGILDLYDRLLELQPTPIIELNRAVAISMVKGPKAGLALIEQLDNLSLKNYVPFYLVKAHLLAANGHNDKSIQTLSNALELNLTNQTKTNIELEIKKLNV